MKISRRWSILFRKALDHEHVGLPLSSVAQTLLRREATPPGRTINDRVIVSNFDAVFRVVASGLAVAYLRAA